jgi:plasmid stabilization system protein ParE
MIGGLLFSQSLTLLSTPALYVIFSCLAERWRARRARRREAKLLKRAQRVAAHPRMAWIGRPLAGFLRTANLPASGRHYRGGPPSIFHAHPQ